MRYGVPYTGSKNGIAKWVIDNLPRAKNFVDVFAGGCAITHAALLSGKYENFIANDLSPAPQLFLDAIHGKYRDEKRWISREDFFRLKDTDAYVKYCFSFGNDGQTYMYGKGIEPWKKALHYAIVYDDKRLIAELLQRPELHRGCESLERLHRLQSLERLHRLQSLENLKITESDYRRVFIPEDAVIYCDPPYINTIDKYKNPINHEEFYQWCERQENLVVVSEYTMPKDRFVRVSVKEKRQTLSATANNKVKEEGLYVPRAQEDLYWHVMEDEPMNEFYERMSVK